MTATGVASPAAASACSPGHRAPSARRSSCARPLAKALADDDAPAAALIYVNDTMPGIRRLRRGKYFAYVLPDGKPLRDEREIARIRKLAIPPAYIDVWICPDPNGHLQATGRDARGRKQYRYHPEWRVARDADKFVRMLEFGAVLPRIRRHVQRRLLEPVGEHPTREAVLAALVRLLDTTLVRIGNDEYARTNGSYGLTTLRNRHAAVHGKTLRLRFKGKHGIVHDVAIDDPGVARIVRRCQAMPGQELFEYEDEDGHIRCIGSLDVNDYLRELSGADFTAKDFRTWHASAHALHLARQSSEEGQSRRSVKEILAEVAARLGNTVAVCRKSYVHPKILEAALQGLPQGSRRSDGGCAPLAPRRAAGLSAAERELVDFLSVVPPSLKKARGSGRRRESARTAPSGAHCENRADDP